MTFDFWTVLSLCAIRRYIAYNFEKHNDYDNFTVLEPAKILELLTNKKWDYRREEIGYKPKKNEYVVRRWKNGAYNHFNMEDFDSLQESETVKNGKIESYRVFRLL